MDDVRRLQGKHGALPDRQTQFVRCFESSNAGGRRIANAPPEALTDYFDRRFRCRGSGQPGPDTWHQPDGVGQQGEENDDRKSHPAPSNQAPRVFLRPRLSTATFSEEEQAERQKSRAARRR